MSLTLSSSPFWLIFCLLVAIGIAAYAYRQTPANISAGTRYSLATLRGSAVFLMLILLLQPVALQSETIDEHPVIAVLVDASRSMPSITDEQELGEHLGSTFDTVHELSDEANLFLFTFGEHLSSHRELSPSLNNISFEGQRTNIGGSLLQAGRQFQDQALGAMVLLTDGHSNTGPDVIESVRRLGTPVHTVAVGDTLRPQMVQINRIQTNETAFLDRETPVRIHAQANGIAGETVEVRLYRDDAELDVTTFEAPADNVTETVDLAFTPAEEGAHSYRVEMDVISSEHEGITATDIFSLRSRAERRRAMLIGGGPSPTVTTLRRVAEQYADLDLITHVERADGSFYEGPIATPADSVDLLILAGYPTSRSSPNELSSVNEMLEAGTPVFLQLTTQVNHVALSDFTQHLPFHLDGSFSDLRPSTLEPSRAAADHPAFTHASISGGWQMLPELHVPHAGWRLRADARPLMETDDGTPAIASREFSAHRSAAVLAPNAWQWYNLPASVDQQRDLWRHFLRDLMQWSIADPAGDRLIVAPARPDFLEDERVTFDVEVRDEQGRPEPAATIHITVYGPGGETHTATLERESGGIWQGDMGQLPPGSYDFEAVVEVDESTSGTDRGSFTVGTFDPEEAFAFADGALLQDVARQTGGTFRLPDEVNDLPDALRGQLQDTVPQRDVVQERLFWQWPLVLGLILSMFSAEWFIRKRKGLP